MPLTIGEKLGPYEILAPLGADGSPIAVGDTELWHYIRF